MIVFDFKVIEYIKNDNDNVAQHRIRVEKMPIKWSDITLDTMLKKLFDLDEDSLAKVIEQLDGAPYGRGHLYTVGNCGRILIEQINR